MSEYASAALWSILVFAGLVLILRFTAAGKIAAALRERSKAIQDSIDNARRERAEADRLLAQYRQQIDRAREAAAEIIDEGRRDAEAVRRRIEDEARRDAAEVVARARREIELLADDAVKRIYDEAAAAAVAAAAEQVRRSLTPDGHRALLRESISRMSAAGGARRN
ncbi:MAG: ATP synthase subunit b [Phycisphaerae bacterium]|nr:ATP synthase subunit b [Phycisphaerae bacterium]